MNDWSRLELVEGIDRSVLFELFAATAMGLTLIQGESAQPEVTRVTRHWFDNSMLREDKNRFKSAHLYQEEFIARLQYWGTLAALRCDKGVYKNAREVLAKAPNRSVAFALYLVGLEAREVGQTTHGEIDRLCRWLRRLDTPFSKQGRRFRKFTYEAAAALHSLVDMMRGEERDEDVRKWAAQAGDDESARAKSDEASPDVLELLAESEVERPEP